MTRETPFNICRETTIEFIQQHLIPPDEQEDWRFVEATVARMLVQVLSGAELPEAWKLHKAGNMPLVAVHTDFQDGGSMDKSVLAQVKTSLVPPFQELCTRFTDAGLIDFQEITRVLLPMACIGVNSSTLDEDMNQNGFTSRLRSALSQIPYWKASTHILFSDGDNLNHDYPSYVRRLAEELDVPLQTFLQIQLHHENNHIPVDVALAPFKGYGTWLHEGACELLTGFDKRAKRTLRCYKQSGKTMTPEGVLSEEDSSHVYGGGWLMLREVLECLGVKFHNIVNGSW